MEQLIPFSSSAELEAITRKYEACTRRKFFKITWFHRGLLESADDTVVQKTMIFGAHGQVWYYDIYASYKISPLKTHLIMEGALLRLERLLHCGFERLESRGDISWEGYEITWFYENGRVRHRYIGDVFENVYLQRILTFAERAIITEWVLVQKKKVW